MQFFYAAAFNHTFPVTLGDIDSRMRLVEVRDLMAGQNWFDLMQYRLGIAPGVEMHWSRVVDAPLAALVWLGARMGFGDALVYYAWPALLSFAGIAAILAGYRRVAPQAPLLIAGIIGGFALLGGFFRPGDIDHHNIQTVLALWLVTLLLPGEDAPRRHGIAGVIAAAMPAIGIETLPYVIAAGAWVALAFAVDGENARAARAFGLGLAGGTAALFFGLVGPDRHAVVTCEGFSLFHLVMAGGAGAMLAAAAQASLGWPGPVRRLGLLAVVGVLTLTLVLTQFPQCFADPLATFDPRLKAFWLDHVIEAKSLFTVAGKDPTLLPRLVGLPVLALVVCLHALVTGRARAAHGLLTLMLAMALAVTAWQIRGMHFSTAFAALPLALWVQALRAGGARPVTFAAAGLASLLICWQIFGLLLSEAFSREGSEQRAALAGQDVCSDAALLAPIKAEPAGVLLGNINMGPTALLETPHRVLAAPYHRNIAGNLVLIDVMTAKPDDAVAMMRKAGITLIAACTEGGDEKELIAMAPQGLMAQLMVNETPNGLTEIPVPAGHKMRFWKVQP